MGKQIYLEASKVDDLPNVSNPGAYPIFYVTKSHEVLCSKCASKEADNIAGHDINWEEPINCDRCNEDIEPAYEKDDNENG